MKLTVLKESGFEEALLGLSLSFNSEPSKRVADKLAWKGGGESKFLESIVVWIDLDAPRYFWQQLDTYRIGVTKQSESTMHTILRGSLSDSDFEEGCWYPLLKELNFRISLKDFRWVKRNLPESFLQRREICVNYKTLQNMCMQRATHKLPEWQLFIKELVAQIEHPDYVYKELA